MMLIVYSSRSTRSLGRHGVDFKLRIKLNLSAVDSQIRVNDHADLPTKVSYVR
jgi:hypothetical protein